MEEKYERFRDGIFALHTRRFGTVAEIMVKKLYGLDESGSLAYDKAEGDKRVEVKFSTVLRENDSTINEGNVLDQIDKANFANRAMNSTDSGKFDSNIQQIKRAEFDKLYYGLFFADQVEVYEMDMDEVGNAPGYSNKQHRGNDGEGQFHLNPKTIDYHRQNHLKDTLTYEELYDLLKK